MAEELTPSFWLARFSNASPWQKALWLGLPLLLVALAAAYVYWHSRPDYRVLFAHLSDRDGGAVVEALDRLNIPYRLVEPNGAVEVPSDHLYAARYKLAALGLPKGDKREPESPSYGGFGFSQFQEQLGYQHGLEAELAKSVEAIDGVEIARVHLALPRQTSFLRERVPPAASVLLKLRPAVQLNEQQVESIRHIIAHSVPGMLASQVSVVDQSGVLLAAGVAGLYRSLSADQLEFTRRLEKEYGERVSALLSPVLPENGYKVQITAQLDFGESGQTSPAKRRRDVREPGGAIRRLSALVVLDEETRLERRQLAKVEQLTRQAIGYDSRRRDSVQVIAVPFKSTAKPQAVPAKTESLKNLSATPAPALEAGADAPSWSIYAGLALAAITALLLLFIKKRGQRAPATEILESAEPSPAQRFDTELEAIRGRVLEDPKVTASVIKLWMQT